MPDGEQASARSATRTEEPTPTRNPISPKPFSAGACAEYATTPYIVFRNQITVTLRSLVSGSASNRQRQKPAGEAEQRRANLEAQLGRTPVDLVAIARRTQGYARSSHFPRHGRSEIVPRLVLASTSPYRKALLSRLGVPFEVVVHRSTEDGSGPPRVLAPRLAEEKARSVAVSQSGAFIIGSDQIVALDGERLGKPGTVQAAEAQLRRLQNRAHELVTAVVLISPDGTVRRSVSVHKMTMRPLADDEIRQYVAFDNPLDCCGAYKIESAGIALFKQISGDDPTAIEGLPLMALSEMLRESGFI